MGQNSDPIKKLLKAPVGYLPAQIFGDSLDGVEDQIDRFVLFPKRKNARVYVTLKPETAHRLGVQLVEVRSRRLRKQAKYLVHLPPGEPLKRWSKIKSDRPWEEGQTPIQFPEQKQMTRPCWIEFLRKEPEKPKPKPPNRTPTCNGTVTENLWTRSINGLSGGLDHKPQSNPTADGNLQRLLREANQARIKREARKRKRSRSKRKDIKD